MYEKKEKSRWGEREILFIKTVARALKMVFDFEKNYFAASIVLTFLLGLTSALTIYATKILINILQLGVEVSDKFIIMLVIYGAINIVISLINNIQNYVSEKHRLYVDNKLDVLCLEKCKHLSLKDFEDDYIYNIINRATEMGRTKIYELYINLLSLIQSIVAMISIYMVIMNVNKYLFLLVLIMPLISTYTNISLGKKRYSLLRKRTIKNRKLSYINYLLTNNIAIKEILSYGCHGYLINKFKEINTDILDENNKFIKFRTIINFILSLCEEIVSIIVIVCVISMTRVGDVLLGDMVAYINSLSTITENLKNFLNCISNMYNDKLYIEDFFTFLDLEEETEIEGEKLKEIRNIAFDNVSFFYKDTNKAIIKNISLQIDRSRPIAIIGENGAGKTTLIKLIAGLYKNYLGDIKINGVEMRKLSSKSYKAKIGIVFQDFNKYELSVRENIGMAELEKINNDKEIYQVLNTVDMDEEIGKDLDMQMGNWFGGRELSKGQWQRIAIARAIIRESDVLVLDEPTAALDPIMEREIFRLIKNISKEKILIFITHRVSNLLEFNPYIFIMENGQIVSSGSQEELKDDIHFNMLLTGSNKN